MDPTGDRPSTGATATDERASLAAFAPDLPAGSGTRAAVIGGGAVGVTAAHDLAAAGADVVLFERGEIASGSSGRAAGVVYDAFAEDVDARIADRALERFSALSADGASNDPDGAPNHHSGASNDPDDTSNHHDDTSDHHDGAPFSFTPCPYAVVVREGDDRRAAALREAVERMRVHGRDVSTVAPDALADRFPLRTDDLAVAAVAEAAGWTDPGSYVRAVADRAAATGATIRTGTEASIRYEGGGGPGIVAGGDRERFDAVLVAAGARTKRLLADAGLSIPLKPFRVQALTSRRPYEGPMCYDATGGFYLRPHPTGLLAGDGTEPVEADPEKWTREGDARFVEEVREGVRRRTGDEVDLERAWAGLCTATPDRNPLLGELRPGLFVATGWQGHGFMRAPATAEAAARSVLGGEGVAPFDPRRFDGDEEFEIVEGMKLG